MFRQIHQEDKETADSFVTRLIEERGLWEPDILIRISLDGGGNSLKMILNIVNKHPNDEVTFPYTEKKGNLLSGVYRSILLAYCEELEENYHNIRIIFKLMQVNILFLSASLSLLPSSIFVANICLILTIADQSA